MCRMEVRVKVSCPVLPMPRTKRAWLVPCLKHIIYQAVYNIWSIRPNPTPLGQPQRSLPSWPASSLYWGGDHGGGADPSEWNPSPQISYEASSVILSAKRQYPSFLRTIPSDKHQVEVMVRLLQSFGWVWISLIGSYGDYGQLGVRALEELATSQGICIAFKDIIPFSARVGEPRMQRMMDHLAQARTTVVVVFSNRHLARVFFRSVVLAQLTGKVWIASEDWAISTYISKMPGIQGIGTVLGVSIQQRQVPGLREFEESYVRAVTGAPRACPEGSWCSSNQLCRECHAFTAHSMPTLGAFSMSAAYNVYQAVYAVAHGLHQLLGCTSKVCSRGPVYPWQVRDSSQGVGTQNIRSQEWGCTVCSSSRCVLLFSDIPCFLPTPIPQ